MVELLKGIYRCTVKKAGSDRTRSHHCEPETVVREKLWSVLQHMQEQEIDCQSIVASEVVWIQ